MLYRHLPRFFMSYWYFLIVTMLAIAMIAMLVAD